MTLPAKRMSSRSTLISAPVIFLIVLMLVSRVGMAISNGQGIDTYGYEFFYGLGFIWAIGAWLQLDSMKYRVSNPYCPGLLLTAAWPILLTHHLYRTRGAKGFLIVLGFVAVVVMVQVLATVAYFLSAGAVTN